MNVRRGARTFLTVFFGCGGVLGVCVAVVAAIEWVHRLWGWVGAGVFLVLAASIIVGIADAFSEPWEMQWPL